MEPYCGQCHRWLDDRSPAERDRNVCICFNPDFTKDPNCHNANHDHYDPESPIVLGQRAIDAAELEREEEARRKREEESGGICPGAEVVDGSPSPDTLAELDEILEDTNQQVEVDEPFDGDSFSGRTHGPPHHGHGMSAADFSDSPPTQDCFTRGHIWVCMGKVGFNDHGLSVVDWGSPECLRCKEPMPEGEEALVDDPSPAPWWDEPAPEEPKHACPGCNLKDLTMEDAKEHIRKLLIEAPNTQTARDAACWMRLDGKIRAWEGG